MRVDEIQILLDQGRIALNQSRYEEAQELLDRVLEEDNYHEQALNLKGLLLFKQERFQEAVGLFQRLVDQYPEEPTLLMNLGLAYLKSEQFDRAIEELQKALAHGPTPKIHNYLGLAYSGKGQLQNAQTHFLEGGSKRMADQMLQMMQASTSQPSADASDKAVPEPAEETASATTEVQESDDAVDSAFAQTFDVEEKPSPPTPATSPQPLQQQAEAAGAKDSTVPTTKDDAVPADTDGASASHKFQAAETGPPGAEVAPTDLLGSALHLLRDRYEWAMETSDAGRNLKQLAERLGLSRNRSALVEQPRPNLVRLSVGSEQQTLARLRDLLTLEGDLRTEIRKKRYKGKDLATTFGGEQQPVCGVVGQGDVFLDAGAHRTFFTISLEEELVYLVESVFAGLVGTFHWENGRLPGDDGHDLHLVQMRGTGTTVLQIPEARRLAAVRLQQQQAVLPVERLAGWYGNVVPMVTKLPVPGAGAKHPAIQFQGRGTLLVLQAAPH